MNLSVRIHAIHEEIGIGRPTISKSRPRLFFRDSNSANDPTTIGQNRATEFITFVPTFPLRKKGGSVEPEGPPVALGTSKLIRLEVLDLQDVGDLTI